MEVSPIWSSAGPRSAAILFFQPESRKSNLLRENSCSRMFGFKEEPRCSASHAALLGSFDSAGSLKRLDLVRHDTLTYMTHLHISIDRKIEQLILKTEELKTIFTSM